MSYGKALRNIDRRVRKINRRIELKFHNTQFEANAAIGSSTFDDITDTVHYHLSAIPANAGKTGRIGREVTLTSVKLKLHLLNDPGISADPYNTLRIVIYRYNDRNYDFGGLPPFEAIFDEPDVQYPDMLLMAQYNNTNNKAYKIYYDRIHFLGSSANQSLPRSRVFDIKIPLNHELSFTENSTQPEHGGVYLLVYSDSTASPHPTVSCNARLYYKDA